MTFVQFLLVHSWKCPDPSLCSCGECDELREIFADCSPHSFEYPGQESVHTQITFFRKPTVADPATSYLLPTGSDLVLFANKYNVHGE